MIAVNECLQSDKCQPQAGDREDNQRVNEKIVNECLRTDKCQPQASDREGRLQGKRHQRSKMRKKLSISICKKS